MARGFVGIGFLLLSGLTIPARAADDGAEFFERDVRPILVERCAECHGESGKPKGGLRLISRATLLKGGDSGPAAVAGKPDESLLVAAIRYVDEPKMPPKAKLNDREIATLTRWVALGLPWPEAKVATPAPVVAGAGFQITDEQRRFWAFQPLKDVPPPPVKDSAWSRSALDRFILAGLEAKGLKPSRPADKRTLIRRATFDLTGLPPTPDEVEAFIADSSPDAFARLVDRLLDSPRYGERWGRHWLDVVRYTDSFDSRGVGSEGDCAFAWRYRDWVVSAFNRDLPYDEFVTRQLAGDLISASSPGGFNAADVIATGMLAIGNWGGGDADKEKLLTDIADDQVDLVGRAFLGLTIACARCHDHKFDPIATKDYYGLAGIFFSTHILPNVGPKTNGPPMLRIPLESTADAERRVQYARRVAEREGALKSTLDEARTKFARELLPETARYVLAAWDYLSSGSHRPLADFAKERNLHEFALRQWGSYLGLVGNYQRCGIPSRDVFGNPGIHGWTGGQAAASMTVNTTDKEAVILTFRLPPRSVSVHPGPQSGVVVGWKSPIGGNVRVSGRLADGDGACGDGVAWTLDHRRAWVTRTLASGAFENGGAQDLAGTALDAVEVKPGDLIQLVVFPKGSHACDTTTVALKIEGQGGAPVWDLSRDLVGDPLQGNPHADSLGHADVWRFEDSGTRSMGPAGENAGDSPLGRWKRATGEASHERPALERAAADFGKSFDKVDASSPFWLKEPADERLLPKPARASLAAIRNELETLRKNPPPPLTFATGAQDGGVPDSPHAGVHDVKVHIRGSYARLGELVPRHFPVILAGDAPPTITSGSGRLELARWLTRPEHSLTARVMVNRIWQYHFGEGIVRTPSNFGKLGERPTHPELLDHLARQFIAEDWSIKRMHRALMLSATYQQSSVPSPATLKADPDNRLFGRMNRRRLEAEAVRDNLLAVSGKLDLTTGGPAVRDFNTPRRTLYLMTIRSDRSGFGPLFDVADSTAMVDKRAVSTVAPQALFLLNSPFVLDQAQALARRVQNQGPDDRSRIDFVYALLYGRPPSDEERRIGLESLAVAADDPQARAAAWEAYCQVLLCANELIYVD